MKIPSFTLRGFRRPRESLGLGLGKLEGQAMSVIWRRGLTSVRDIYELFDRRIAYTTLMTTLDRLYQKGLLDRRKNGRAFLYSPRLSPQEFEQGVAMDLLDGLLGGDNGGVEPLLACIVEAVSERDRLLLDSLDRLIKEKKEALRRKV